MSVENGEGTLERPAQRLARLLKKAAAKEIKAGDPWSKHRMDKIPAERVIRHLYQPHSKTWTTDETIVKMEPEPFTHGAMRFCYRLKKRSPPPQSASNHRFHNYGWHLASNYVAKAYQKEGEVDCSDEAKQSVKNDILLQYEAAFWANKFNEKDPPKKLVFIRAYAIEFPDREGKPWFAVERYITGTDSYGCGFTKHNTNAGFVDEDIHRVTPQVFSAYSFYESGGERLVADIQGVGDLYTDPQVLSSDYRFGDGDLGPRGMALFFKTFRHNTLADSMGIPVFALSKNELKHQAKYEDDIDSLNSGDSSYHLAAKGLNRFAALDLNRSRREAALVSPPQQIIPDDMKDTERHSNRSRSREDIRKSLQQSIRVSIPPKARFSRTSSDVDEVRICLDLAQQDFKFDHRTFRRKASGEMIVDAKKREKQRRPSLLIRTISDPIAINPDTRANLGKVHYQLAVLHGLGRFPEIVPTQPDEDIHDLPPHDVFSVLYHLSHAASMNCVAASLSLGRLHAGLGTSVSILLDAVVPIDFEAAKQLLRRAMESPFPPTSPKVAAGCLLYQIFVDERESDNLEDEKACATTLVCLLEDLLALFKEMDNENQVVDRHKERHQVSRGLRFHVGDRVEGNYCLEGTYYPGVVESLSDDGIEILVKYDDDNSTENLTCENVRLVIPPTATQTALGGPLTDEEALGAENSDEKCLISVCDLKAELAELKEKLGDVEAAASLFEDASNVALSHGLMKKATEWSLKASELMN